MEDARIYLDQVTGKIKRSIEALEESIVQGEREIEGMHEYYWENYTEMDQYGYENFDNQQALLGQVNANQAMLKKRSRLKRMLDSPYFGRVDFCFDGEDEAETFYIGIGSFAEKKGGIPLIYDWRAPVSSLFYDYDQGEASYEAPGGRMEGEITSKWQYKIRDGRLIYAFESDTKIDDEVLRRELGASGDVKLKNIIRTIQKEQNAIIRNTKDRIMVIQGVAGSGKTSVALHRIAYLLYHDRENLKSSNVLILSPNSVFSDYISHILPELGEENIREMSFDLFAYRELNQVVHDCEDRYDEIERKLLRERTGEAEDRETVRKRSSDFITELREFVLFEEDRLMRFTDFKYKNFQKTAKEIMEMFYYRFPDVPLLSRMQAVMEYFVDEYETLVNKDFDEEDLEKIRERFFRMYRTTDLYVLYSRFLEEYGYTPLPRVKYEKRYLAYEDVYPMLYLKYLLYAHSGHKQIRHLVIDEMQDYSYLQYLILEQLFQCKMTILGDKAQTMDSEQSDVMKFLPRIFGRQIRRIEMNKSYRNTVEIAQYAGKISHAEGMELFERHGREVEEREFAVMEAALAEALKRYRESAGENYETSAVLVTTEAEARAAYEWLKAHMGKEAVSQEAESGTGQECGNSQADRKMEDALDSGSSLTYIDRNSSRFRKGLTVTTFYLAKGLEFDQVFSVTEKRMREKPLHRQAEYICATRAMHELHMYRYG